MTTVEYLDSLKSFLSITSDYQLAKMLGVTRATVSAHRSKHKTFSDNTALKVANLLKLPPEQVLLDMQIERSNCPDARKAWKAIRRILGKGNLLIMFGMSTLFAWVLFAANTSTYAPQYILCKIGNIPFSFSISSVLLLFSAFRLSFSLNAVFFTLSKITTPRTFFDTLAVSYKNI